LLIKLRTGIRVLILVCIFSTLPGCAGSIAELEDYLGLYRVIKIRENGTILNIDVLTLIELNDELYISSIDRNDDQQISEDEKTATSYSFHLDEDNNPFLMINNIDRAVELLPDHHYDLLLKKIDQFGNETVIYLKK